MRNKGFTLIELSAIILVIVLLAALAVPRMAAAQRSIEAKLSMDAVQRLASRARETAISSGRPVAMAYNDTDSEFELRQTNEEGDGQVVGTASLHDDFQMNRFVAGSADMSASDWTVSFYPDATSDGGSVEVDEGGIVRTLVIGSKSGLSRWQDGGTPANENDRWQAGEFERRG